jgi:hypothetical protein
MDNFSHSWCPKLIFKIFIEIGSSCLVDILKIMSLRVYNEDNMRNFINHVGKSFEALFESVSDHPHLFKSFFEERNTEYADRHWKTHYDNFVKIQEVIRKENRDERFCNYEETSFFPSIKNEQT